MKQYTANIYLCEEALLVVTYSPGLLISDYQYVWHFDVCYVT